MSKSIHYGGWQLKPHFCFSPAITAGAVSVPFLRSASTPNTLKYYLYAAQKSGKASAGRCTSPPPPPAPGRQATSTGTPKLRSKGW